MDQKDQVNSARRQLWFKSNLKWKLDQTQKELYDLFYNSNFKIFTWVLSRRQGKTYTLIILAIEQCLRQPNSIVKFLSPTKIQVQNNVRPIIRQILMDCPEELKPDYNQKDYIYYFKNGSELQLAGSDNGHAEKLRGGDSHLFFVDEAGSCDNLEDTIKSILLPTTLITKGRGILAGTPPKEATHDFIKYIEEAEVRGSLIKRTVYDNPRITPDQLQELITELGGIHTEAARRELLCDIIRDSTTAVIPEFDEDVEKECVKEWPLPPYYDSYVAMDLGFKDLTVVLFGYYDFRADKVIIQDEIVYNFQEKDKHLKDLAELILQKEEKLWRNPMSHELKKPTLRVSDIDYIALNELYRHSNHRLSFTIPNKYDNESSINTLRVMIGNKKIIIHPRCQTLIRHLKNAKWKKGKQVFDRSPDNGHYDAVDALKYFIKSVNYTKNPYPTHYGMHSKELFHMPGTFETTRGNDQVNILKRVFAAQQSKRKW